MSCVNIRGCRIGEGRPKVILPIVERTEAAILEKAAQFSTLSADCVEWRADWFEGFQSPAAIARCVQKLRVTLRDKLLLVTFRTKAEGGEQALSHKEYLAFLRLILDTDCVDLLDIEFFTAGADLPKLVEQAHSAGVAVVCSSHDFAKTPPGQSSSVAWYRCSRPEPTCPSWPSCPGAAPMYWSCWPLPPRWPTFTRKHRSSP